MSLDWFPSGMTMRIVIPEHDFFAAPLWWFCRDLNELRIATKKLSRYEYDNNHQAMSLGGWGTEFTFSVTNEQGHQYNSPADRGYRERFGAEYQTNNVFSIYFYGRRGAVQVFTSQFVADRMKPIPEAVRHAAMPVLQAYAQGKQACHDCGDVVSRYGMHSFWASRYCDSCWLGDKGKYVAKGGWKLVESKENYE